MEDKKHFKAFIRVVKSLVHNDSNYGFDTIDVIREPLIMAKNKVEVKEILLNKYPQFFQNEKVYEKESKKDKAQFFYVVIFPLYQHEINLINEGEWVCEQCNHKHENKYISRPIISDKFGGLMFCGNDYNSGNDVMNHSCYDNWKFDRYKNEEIPDDINHIHEDSLNYIYKITEKETGKCYIGKTRNIPFFRWWNHLKHSGSPFGLYLRETKLSEWTFEVLEELPSNIIDSEVLKIESDYMIKFNSIDNGYNSVISNKNSIINNENQQDLFTKNKEQI